MQSSDVKGLRCEVRSLRFEAKAKRQATHVIMDLETLDASAGSLTVLAGPSGSGKSTLLYLLAGLLLPTRGSVSWGGLDVSTQGESARDRWRLDNAGFIFQSFNLIEELSPLENVLMPARFGGRAEGSLRERAEALLMELGVPGRTTTSLLSRGEQQRVAVARALLRDPKVIFADEPTASLDAATAAQVAALLRELAARQGRTVIVASHDAAVLKLADHMVSLDRGRRVAAEIRQVAA